jgi:tetratricopeptide (TPR) repeat protein
MRTGLFQLPPDIDDFTGRDDALQSLQDMLEPSEDQATCVVVSSIAGRAGVGKTALATRIAHKLRPSFPDGQLYVNLRGAEAQRLKPDDVLGEFLLELGVARAAIPDRLDQRAARYRAQLADRRVLVVLDNAAEAAQVQPLLPDSPGSAALITSRAQLGGLAATHSIVLDVLERDQAIALLARVVGADRVAAEPEAARMIVELCGHLPLAVRIAGAKLPATGDAPLAVLADRLAGEHGRLAELQIRDLEVRASFARNYLDLHEEERHLFRLLGLLRAPDFSAWVAAALLEAELAEAERLIGQLAEAEVLEVAQQTPSGQVRHRFHDLLRVFARERLWAEESPASQETALHRVLAAYLALARHAADLLEPQGAGETQNEARPVPQLSAAVERLTADPASWFEVERMSLIAAVEQASDNDLREQTWELARALTYFFKLRTHWTDWQHTQQLALRAARRAQNRQATANALRSLGDAYAQLGRFQRAVSNFEQALALFGALEDRLGKAWTHVGLGNAYWEQGIFDQAVTQLEPGLALFAALEDRRGQGWALEGLAIVHRYQGRFDESLACLNRGLGLFRAVGDDRGEAYCLVNLGAVHRDKGQFQAALEWFDQAQPIFVRLADHHGEAYVLLNKGHMLREQGRHEEALACLDGCLTAFVQMGERAGDAWTRLNRGIVYQAQGRLDRAIAELNRCRELFEVLGDRRGAAFVSMGFGHVYLAKGSWEGLAHFEEAVETLREIGDRLGLAKALNGCGLALAASGDRAAAARMWRAALAIFQELGASESSMVEALLAD